MVLLVVLVVHSTRTSARRSNGPAAPYTMSHRETRALSEALLTLGYNPTHARRYAYRKPHFTLLASTLSFLLEKLNAHTLAEIQTEHDRVAFVKHAAELALNKARIKLNPKALYAADGRAVRELNKLAQYLLSAHAAADAALEEGHAAEAPAFELASGAPYADIERTRALSSELVQLGARLHEALGEYDAAKESAAKALGANRDVGKTQVALRALVDATAAQAASAESALANVATDEAALTAKIAKKRAELERHSKRLSSLASVRPAFMDELERVEAELAVQYAAYVRAHRNLAHLDAEVDALVAAEVESAAESERRLQSMQRRLRNEELKVLRGQAEADERSLEREAAREPSQKVQRPDGASTGGRRQPGARPPPQAEPAFGSMRPDDDDDSPLSAEESDDDDDFNRGQVSSSCPSPTRPPLRLGRGEGSPQKLAAEFRAICRVRRLICWRYCRDGESLAARAPRALAYTRRRQLTRASFSRRHRFRTTTFECSVWHARRSFCWM